jgi:hypothetical protein
MPSRAPAARPCSILHGNPTLTVYSPVGRDALTDWYHRVVEADRARDRREKERKR